MVRLLRSVRWFVAPLALVLPGLCGCDEASFSRDSYELAYDSTAIAALKVGAPLGRPERWLYAPDYVPPFCTSATTTTGPGAATVEIDWHGCTNVPGTDFVGTFEFVGGGVYEGLVDVTTEAAATGGTPLTFTALMRLEPR